MKKTFGSAKAVRIYERTEKALLRERIHQTRRDLAKNDALLLNVHLHVSSVIAGEDWQKIDRLTYNTMISINAAITKRQKDKFNRLSPTNTATHTLDTRRTIINLSSRQLSEDQISVLGKGANYAVTPRTVPVEDIVASIEASIRKLPTEISEEIRSESARILRHAQSPKSNLSAKERRALKTTRDDCDIIVLPADKGNATVVMDWANYQEKMENLLDPEIYSSLKKDPTQAILRKTNQLIKKTSLSPEIQKTLMKTEARPPRLYGLPKIHKPDTPLRPIVNSIGSPIYDLARHLTSLLKPHIGRTSSYIKDSTHFVERLKNITISHEDILVSFDVVSLFTNVPVKDTMDYIKEVFPKDISDLFHTALTTTYFQWNNKYYEQNDGVAMGSPLSPAIANFYMEKFEGIALQSAEKQPSHWLRFVDDTFVVWSHGEEELHRFLKHLNSVHPKIQFTMETEREKQLAFLDVMVIRYDNLQLGHKVHRKTTHTDRYLHFDSNHLPRQKRGVIKSLVDRAIRISEPRYLQDELEHLRRTLQANGYRRKDINRAIRPRKTSHQAAETKPAPVGIAVLPFMHRITDRIGKLLEKQNIRTIYKPIGKIQDHLRSAKDPPDPLTTAGVYRIPCTCGQVYIGTTKRSVRTRLSEHQRNCRQLQLEKSAVAEHAVSEGHHLIQFTKTQVLSNTSQYSTRLAREAIEIFKHPNNFNRKEECMAISKIWNPLLKNCRIKPYAYDVVGCLASADQSGNNSGKLRPLRPAINTEMQAPLVSDRIVPSQRTLRPRDRPR